MKHTGFHTIIVDNFDTIFCSFIEKDGQLECSKCGNIVQVSGLDNSEPIKIPCRSPLLGQNIAQSIFDFAAGIDNLKLNLCDKQTIEHRLSICKNCEFYSDNSCSKCGCSITRDRNYLNKIAVKNESCPINLWTKLD